MKFYTLVSFGDVCDMIAREMMSLLEQGNDRREASAVVIDVG
jgi:hypothetical protein